MCTSSAGRARFVFLSLFFFNQLFSSVLGAAGYEWVVARLCEPLMCV